MMKKKKIHSFVLASVVLGASSIAFAGAYGEAEQPEEIPAPAPAAARAAGRHGRRAHHAAADGQVGQGGARGARGRGRGVWRCGCRGCVS